MRRIRHSTLSSPSILLLMAAAQPGRTSSPDSRKAEPMPTRPEIAALPRATFRNPLKQDGADPWLTYYQT